MYQQVKVNKPYPKKARSFGMVTQQEGLAPSIYTLSTAMASYGLFHM
jgi:hypothetical protein